MQIEGREYIVQGNDMMYVRFNVLSCIYKKKKNDTLHCTGCCLCNFYRINL